MPIGNIYSGGALRQGDPSAQVDADVHQYDTLGLESGSPSGTITTPVARGEFKNFDEVLRYIAMSGIPWQMSDRQLAMLMASVWGANADNASTIAAQAEQYLRSHRVVLFDPIYGDEREATGPPRLGRNSPGETPDPSHMGDGRAYGVGDLFMVPFNSLNRADFERLQRSLYDAGFYNQDAGIPQFGDRSDPGFREAWRLAITEYTASGEEGMSIEAFLVQRALNGGPLRQDFVLPTEQIQLSSAAFIRERADQISIEKLGRGLTDPEKATMVELIHALETEQQMQGINMNADNELAAMGLNPGTVTGSMGPDQVAEMANSLAQQYGLSIVGQWRDPADTIAIYGYYRDSDHHDGMAVDFSGTEAQMEALGAWAAQNEGEGKLFRWVGWKDDARHYDHVHLSFNSAVGEGATATSAFADTSTGSGQIDQFMAGLREVENGGSYGWENNGYGAYGAYQFLKDTWDYAASIAGVSSYDHSPAAQDAAARALIQKYWEQFGDWKLVAVAWHAGPDDAMKAATQGMDYTRSIGDVNTDTYSYVEKVMAAMGESATPGFPRPNTISTQATDVEAELIEELRRRFPAETQAHDIASVMDRASGLLFGGTSYTTGSSF